MLMEPEELDDTRALSNGDKTKAELIIQSIPQMASIYFDDVLYGMTPLTIGDDLIPGRYQLTVKKDGYQDEKRTIQYSPLRKILITLRLKPAQEKEAGVYPEQG